MATQQITSVDSWVSSSEEAKLLSFLNSNESDPILNESTFKQQANPQGNNPHSFNAFDVGNEQVNPLDAFDSSNNYPTEEARLQAFLNSQKLGSQGQGVQSQQGTIIDDLNKPLLKDDALELLRREKEERDRETQNSSGATYDDNTLYKKAFEIVKDLGYDFIPDDKKEEITPELFLEFQEADRQRRIQEAYDAVLQSAADDKTRRLIETALNGGTIEDVLYIKEKQEEIESIASLDISTEENQRAILTRLFSENLDPNNPAHKYHLDNVEANVNRVISAYEGPEQAKRAQEYFIKKEQQAEEGRLAQIAAEKEAEELKLQKRINDRNQFNKSVDQLVKGSAWSSEQKEKVLSDFYTAVEMEDGRQVPTWIYKYQVIASKPELFQHYLDFISSFDYETEKFTNIVTPNSQAMAKEVNSKLLDFVRNSGSKNQQKTGDFNNPVNQKTATRWHLS